MRVERGLSYGLRVLGFWGIGFQGLGMMTFELMKPEAPNLQPKVRGPALVIQANLAG